MTQLITFSKGWKCHLAPPNTLRTYCGITLSVTARDHGAYGTGLLPATPCRPCWHKLPGGPVPPRTDPLICGCRCHDDEVESCNCGCCEFCPR